MFKKILTTFGTRLLTALINFGIAIVVSQNLGAAGKGDQGIIITTIALINVFSNIVGGASLVYLTPRKHAGLLLIPSYIWSVIVSIVCCLVIFLLGIGKPEFIIHLGFLSVLCSFVAIHSSILLGKEKIRSYNLLFFMQPALVIASLLILFVFFRKLNIYSYFIALYISYITALIVSTYFMISHMKSGEKFQWSRQIETLKDIFKYGAINQTAQILHLLSFRISYYFLEAITGKASVGIYSNAVSLIESIWLVSGSMAMILYSRISNTTDNKYSLSLTAELAKISFMIAFVLIIPLALLPSSFYEMIFGSEFAGLNRLILALAPGIVVYSFTVIIVTYFSGTGKFHINLIASAIGLVLTVVLAIFMIPLLSALGAAITASIAYIAATTFLIIMFTREGKIKVSDMLPTPAFVINKWKEVKISLKQWRKSS